MDSSYKISGQLYVTYWTFIVLDSSLQSNIKLERYWFLTKQVFVVKYWYPRVKSIGYSTSKHNKEKCTFKSAKICETKIWSRYFQIQFESCLYRLHTLGHRISFINYFVSCWVWIISSELLEETLSWGRNPFVYTLAYPNP